MGSQGFPPRHASMMSCHASPVALLGGRRGATSQFKCAIFFFFFRTHLRSGLLCVRSPEEKHEGLDEGLKVVVSIDGRLPLLVQGDVSEQLRRGNHSRLIIDLSVLTLHPPPTPHPHPIPEPNAGYYYRHRSHPPSRHHPDAIKTFLMHPESNMMRIFFSLA